MKVATLTDANVFLLVDAVEGRRFAGKRHLVDAYLGGTLGPVGSDVEMELDPSVTALRRRPVNGVAPGQQRSGMPFRSGSMAPRPNGVAERLAAMKRPMAPPVSKDPADPLAAKRGRLGPAMSSSSPSRSANTVPSNDIEIEPVIESATSLAPSSSNSPPSSKLKDSTSSSKEDRPSNAEMKAEYDVKPSLDIEAFNDDDRSHDVSGLEDPGSGESDIEELTYDEEALLGGGRGGGNRVGGGEFDQSNMSLYGTSQADNGTPSEFTDDFDIIAFMQANPKAAALQAEFDTSVLDKSSVTHKLLTSLLYDVSKASAANAPVKDKKSEVSRAYFNYVFENVWESFPNFERIREEGGKVKDGGKLKNIKYFMRHKMQKWYGAMMDKMLGAENSSSSQNMPALQWN